MNELKEVLAGDSAHARPAEILDGLDAEATHASVPGAPRTIYDELWHIVFWQQITLDWVRGIETPYPLRPSDGLSLCRREIKRKLGRSTAALSEHQQASRSRGPQHRQARRRGPLPLAPRHAYPHHDGAGAAGEPGRSQRLPLRPHRTAAPDQGALAAALRRFQLVNAAACETDSRPAPYCL